MTFEQWLQAVDRYLGRYIGLGHRDLADWTWADAYADEMSPEDAAHSGIENELNS